MIVYVISYTHSRNVKMCIFLRLLQTTLRCYFCYIKMHSTHFHIYISYSCANISLVHRNSNRNDAIHICAMQHKSLLIFFAVRKKKIFYMRKSIIFQLKRLLSGHNWIKYDVYLLAILTWWMPILLPKLRINFIDSKTESINAMHDQKMTESINTMPIK